ncbi:MAG: hypothetical protein ABI718_11515 [Acidobacteriota bacterium]
MKRTCVLFVFLSFLSSLLLAADSNRFDPSGSDGAAVAVADQVMKALGGTRAWDDAHFLRFDFVSERDGKQNVIRSHWWDKWSGRHRVEGKTKDGEPYVVIENINTHAGGQAWKNGVKLSGDEERKFLDSAYGAWVNDTYWLLMPFKMKDPGVNLKDGGVETLDGKSWDKVLLTFENVGLTPKDRYFVSVNRSTHLVDQWCFILNGEDVPPTCYQWKGWAKYGPIMLAPERDAVGTDRKLLFGNLAVTNDMPAAVFESPEAVK